MSAFAQLRKVALLFLIGAIGAGGLASGLALFHFWLFLRLPAAPGERQVREVKIEPGMDGAAIARLLESEGVISDGRLFRLLSLLKQSGHKLRAGEYGFSSLATPEEILHQIVTGRGIIHRITLPEGSNVYDVARILEQSGLASGKEIIRIASDRDQIKRLLGLPVSSLEGFLFPETYHFQKIQSSLAMLEKMTREFWRHFPESWRQRSLETGLSIQEVVVLASMVEKEAVVDSERPLIAAVFLNRLKKGMPLQSDPTSVYDLPDFSGPITAAHLKRLSPYNTYVNKGLPVGPICNPGAKSLKAVLYPEPARYLYFVSQNDGTHHFSETFEEHHLAVGRYQEKRKRVEAQEKPMQRPAPGEPSTVEIPPRSDPATHGIGILERKERRPM